MGEGDEAEVCPPPLIRTVIFLFVSGLRRLYLQKNFQKKPPLKYEGSTRKPSGDQRERARLYAKKMTTNLRQQTEHKTNKYAIPLK